MNTAAALLPSTAYSRFAAFVLERRRAAATAHNAATSPEWDTVALLVTQSRVAIETEIDFMVRLQAIFTVCRAALQTQEITLRSLRFKRSPKDLATYDATLDRLCVYRATCQAAGSLLAVIAP